ncbi:MAG: hypothetical protein ACREKE_05625 [bacterium]
MSDPTPETIISHRVLAPATIIKNKSLADPNPRTYRNVPFGIPFPKGISPNPGGIPGAGRADLNPRIDHSVFPNREIPLTADNTHSFTAELNRQLRSTTKMRQFVRFVLDRARRHSDRLAIEIIARLDGPMVTTQVDQKVLILPSWMNPANPTSDDHRQSPLLAPGDPPRKRGRPRKYAIGPDGKTTREPVLKLTPAQRGEDQPTPPPANV